MIGALATAAASIVLAVAGHGPTRILTVGYRAHDGVVRRAYVEVPSWYGPRHDPPLPLVITPHGRGVTALANLRFWGDLPARGPFILVSPDGQGRRLELYSWGDPGQIRDLARMPAVLRRDLPWLRVDRRRVYAIGGSMGGQEALLLAARYPKLLAGVVSFDAPVDLAARYEQFGLLRNGAQLRELARIEIGGPPSADPRAYALRSPLDYVRRLAFSHVPLQIWWSTRDRIVVHQASQSGLLVRRLRRINPHAPLLQFVGTWQHTAEMHWNRRLPNALRFFHLLPPRAGTVTVTVAAPQ
jgi:pimeloyl-ACP methyl ester carboxylesterase